LCRYAAFQQRYPAAQAVGGPPEDPGLPCGQPLPVLVNVLEQYPSNPKQEYALQVEPFAPTLTFAKVGGWKAGWLAGWAAGRPGTEKGGLWGVGVGREESLLGFAGVGGPERAHGHLQSRWVGGRGCRRVETVVGGKRGREREGGREPMGGRARASFWILSSAGEGSPGTGEEEGTSVNKRAQQRDV
jgi:hypothetical protein